MMILSLDGIIAIMSSFVSILTIASFLDLGTENTRRYTKHPFMRMLFLYSFAYASIPQKIPCLIAVTMFFIMEVQNFISDKVENVIDNVTSE